MRNSEYVMEDTIQSDNAWAAKQVGDVGIGWAAGLFGWSAGALADRRVILVVRLALAAIFLLSALGKLIDINVYSVHAVYEFNILPESIARIFGLVLPFIELICALGLLFGILTRLSALGIGLLSVSFFAAKGIILLRGQDLDLRMLRPDHVHPCLGFYLRRPADTADVPGSHAVVRWEQKPAHLTAVKGRSAGPVTYVSVCPSSGNIFPGFRMPFGSKAHLIRFMSAISAVDI